MTSLCTAVELLFCGFPLLGPPIHGAGSLSDSSPRLLQQCFLVSSPHTNLLAHVCDWHFGSYCSLPGRSQILRSLQLKNFCLPQFPSNNRCIWGQSAGEKFLIICLVGKSILSGSLTLLSQLCCSCKKLFHTFQVLICDASQIAGFDYWSLFHYKPAHGPGLFATIESGTHIKVTSWANLCSPGKYLLLSPAVSSYSYGPA